MYRDMIARRHIPALCGLEERSVGGEAWGRTDYGRALSSRHALGYVVGVDAGNITGAIVCRFTGNAVEVVRLLVDIDHRKHGYGADLLSRVCSKAATQRRAVYVDTHEHDSVAHEFLSRCGFSVYAAIGESVAMQWLGFNDQVLDDLSAAWIAGRAEHSRLSRKGK